MFNYVHSILYIPIVGFFHTEQVHQQTLLLEDMDSSINMVVHDVPTILVFCTKMTTVLGIQFGQPLWFQMVLNRWPLVENDES